MSIFSSFLKNSTKTGAIAPSSKYLAKEITNAVNLENKKMIVELGCGTGAFTGTILEKKNDSAKFFGIEIDSRLAQICKNNFPKSEIYVDSGSQIKKYLKLHEESLADCIISGLPWAVFSDELQDELLFAINKNLIQGGEFATFGYVHGLALPSAKRFRKKLDEYFSSVKKTRIIWPNLPPAFVYYCVK